MTVMTGMLDGEAANRVIYCAESGWLYLLLAPRHAPESSPSDSLLPPALVLSSQLHPSGGPSFARSWSGATEDKSVFFCGLCFSCGQWTKSVNRPCKVQKRESPNGSKTLRRESPLHCRGAGTPGPLRRRRPG